MFYFCGEQRYIGVGSKKSVAYFLPCAEAAADTGQNEFLSEDCHPSDEIDPATLR